MPTLAPAPTIQTVSAASQATKNWRSNLRALDVSQPEVAASLGRSLPEKDWLFARDGSITAMEVTGKWWANCSVPLLASRAMLKTLQSGSSSSCLLCPMYAGMVLAARERVGRWATLLVIQPDLEIARMILAGDDFAEQINRHRLWLVTGENWLQQLREIFSRYTGLATPLQFIRTKLTSEPVITQIISEAQTVFAEVVVERTEQIAHLRAEPVMAADPRQILLLGASQFRLWDDGTAMLHAALSETTATDRLSIKFFDTDEPLSGSPLALLESAQKRGCVISANLCRPDCNNLISTEIPWITWMTQPGAPPFETAGPKDWLILADPTWRTIARETGWPEHRVRVCGFPASASFMPMQIPHKELVLLANTRRIEIPASVKQFSSHRLLWELIGEELAANPFAVDTIDNYLTNRAGQLNISGEVLERRTFTQQLILPAYEQGLARILISTGVSLSLWGEGWSELEEFTSAARGPLTDRDTFNQAIARATALVYCWPEKAIHPIETAGKQVVYGAGNNRVQFTRNVQHALSGANRRPPVPGGSLAKMLSELISCCA